MSTILKLRGAESASQRWLSVLSRLCKKDPLSAHCYAIYYLTHEPDRTRIVLMVSGDNIESYALIWHGIFAIMDIYEVHIWNPAEDVVSRIGIQPNRRADIQLYGDVTNDVGIIIKHFRGLGFRRFHTERFYDMICDHESFKPSPLERLAVRLGEGYAALYKDLEQERGVKISLDEARGILKAYTHYGVIIDNVIASIAARYVTLPEIHIMGGVFTRKEYRGRGYAKAVVSALTREGMESGALAGLHVEIDNESAIRAYTKLGYRIIRARTWIFAYP